MLAQAAREREHETAMEELTRQAARIQERKRKFIDQQKREQPNPDINSTLEYFKNQDQQTLLIGSSKN